MLEHFLEQSCTNAVELEGGPLDGELLMTQEDIDEMEIPGMDGVYVRVDKKTFVYQERNE